MTLPFFAGPRTNRRPRPESLVIERCELRLALAAPESLPTYDIGSPDFLEIWVDPAAGNDTRSGGSRGDAVHTVSEAWRRIPVGTPLSRGVRINLVAGTYGEPLVPNYWERRHGTATAPIMIHAADGRGTVTLPNMNVFDCRHLVLEGLTLTAGGGDVLHLEACSHVLVRNTTIRGTGDIAAYAAPQETFKANQCQYVYVENCDISGATDNAIDFVAVQFGHVVGSRIHRAGDWAMYVKGGSAALTIAGNEIFDAGTGGFTAGQGTGFEFMVAPYLTYEASDITFIRNVIHDTQGAGMGVNGGFNILLADNTLARVGTRSHVIEVVHGLRSCDGDTATCRDHLARGGWGTAVVGREESIPNRNVFVYNNVVFNPDGVVSRWQQFAVADGRTPSAGSNIPSPARADDNLQIRGNVIWNGPVEHALGIETQALAADVRAHNAINTLRPVLVDPARGDYRFAPSFTPPRYAVPAFTETLPGVPITPPVDPPVGPPADTISPRAVRVDMPAAGRYRVGDALVFTIRFSEQVTVAGMPQLTISVGGRRRVAVYESGSGSAAIVFRYALRTGDGTRPTVKVVRTLATEMAAQIIDTAGNRAETGLPRAASRSLRIRAATIAR
jgi:hypothetical protein